MSIVNGTFSLTCSKCGKQHDFNDDDVDFEITSTEERSQGPEICHSWEHSFNCDNEDCDNEIEIEYEVWEYPKGIFNMDKVDINGGTEVRRFSYDFHQDEDNE